MAFDFKTKEFEIIGRVYFNLFRKSHIQERSPAAILFEAVRKLKGREDQKAALDKLEKFFDGGRDGGFEGVSSSRSDLLRSASSTHLSPLLTTD